MPNGNIKDHPTIPAQFVHECVSQHAINIPEHPAVYFDQTFISYDDLDSISNKVARFLLERNLRRQDHVLVIMDRTPNLMAVMLGIFKAGGIFVPINPKYPDEKIRFIIDDCQAHIILCDNLKRLPKNTLYKTTLLNNEMDAISSFPSNKLENTQKTKDDIAYIIYTSGTTGQPKGVMIKHASLMNLFEWYKTCFNIKPTDRASQFASQGFDAFFCETIPFFAIGASVHIIDDSSRLIPNLFFKWLTSNKITICDLPTSFAKVLFLLDWPQTPTLRILKIGGESLTQYPDKIFQFDLWNTYGPSESTIETTFALLAKANKSCEETKKVNPTPLIGKPINNVTCYVVDDKLNQVNAGSTGELLIGGESLSPGYLNRPEITKKKFINNPFSSYPRILYRTGDIVSLREDGNLEYITRSDNQVKIRGYRIELGEIDASILKHSDVGEIITLAKEMEDGNKSLIAWIVPKLEKIRIPWQKNCLISINKSQYSQVITENISREGIAITGIGDDFQVNATIQINITLPGSNEDSWLTGKIIWKQNNRAGIHLSQTNEQKITMRKCLEHYLSNHNLLETLENASIKRNIKQALKNKLPEYMIPNVFCVMPRLPLTFNGKIDIKSLPIPKNTKQILKNHVEAKTETEKELLNIWKQILKIPQISMSDNFFDLGGNSLLVTEFCVVLSNKFNITLPASIFFDRPYIPIIAEFIDSKGEILSENSPVQKQIKHDIQLADDIIPRTISKYAFKPPKNILLTGAGGFLGIHLLKALLNNTDARIYCIIRKGNFQNIAERFTQQVNVFELSTELSLSNRRITLISGDIGLSQFKLPAGQYDFLCKNIDSIYHCGAQVNIMSSYNMLRNSNVIGTEEVLRFATTAKNKAIYYISTLSSAYLKNDKGQFAEVFPNETHEELTGGYALTKWVSERLLTQAMQRGLPVHIYRLGYIFGDSRYGITNINDALLMLIKGCIQLGAAPDWNENICILPVDFVSFAIVSLSLLKPNKSNVYHIDHPKGIVWTELISWFKQKGYKMEIIPHNEWLRKLSNIDQENALYSFLPYYLSMTLPPKTPETGMKNTREQFKQIELKFPKINTKLLDMYFNHLLCSGFLPLPKEKEKF